MIACSIVCLIRLLANALSPNCTEMLREYNAGLTLSPVSVQVIEAEVIGYECNRVNSKSIRLVTTFDSKHEL